MTIRSEIRAALVGGPASADTILAKTPSLDGDARKLNWNLQALRTEGRLRIAGATESGPAWALDEWPVNEKGRTVRREQGASPRAKQSAARRAKSAGGKRAAPTAARTNGERVERASKALVPAPIAPSGDVDQYEVGLMVDGGLMVHNVTQGQIETMPPAFLQQVAQLLQIAAGRN